MKYEYTVKTIRYHEILVYINTIWKQIFNTPLTIIRYTHSRLTNDSSARRLRVASVWMDEYNRSLYSTNTGGAAAGWCFFSGMNHHLRYLQGFQSEKTWEIDIWWLVGDFFEGWTIQIFVIVVIRYGSFF